MKQTLMQTTPTSRRARVSRATFAATGRVAAPNFLGCGTGVAPSWNPTTGGYHTPGNAVVHTIKPTAQHLAERST